MSNMTQNQNETPLFKEGRNGNVHFLTSWKRLDKEEPQLYSKITQREGWEQDIDGYHYKVGMSRYGLWLSRRKLPITIPDNQDTNTSQITQPKTVTNGHIEVDATKDNEISTLKNRVSKLEAFVNSLCESWVMNHQ